MFRTALKGVLANKLRLGLTALAIVLGVSLVSGTFIFTDTINKQFDSLFDEIFEGVDVTVREAKSDFTSTSQGFSPDVVDGVTGVDGVAAFDVGVDSFMTQVIDKDGEPLGGQGPPTLGFSWGTERSLSPLQINEGNGRPPIAPGEVAIDANTAERGQFALGDQVTVINAGGAETFELVGIMSFGDQDSLLGATLTAFELAEAQRLFGYADKITTITLKATDGVSSDDLQARVAAVLPGGLEAVTGQTQQNEQAADIDEALGFINIALLSFAGVAIFVGAFIIQNTFRIIITQRTRELALLRAVGATSRQVLWLVVLEALITAVVASIVGIALGFGMAVAIRGLFNVIGFGLPPGPLQLLPRTIVVGLVVGVGLTLASAVLPARRASRVPPVAAMREELARPKRRSLRNRALVGSGIGALGAIALVFGLFGGPDNAIAYVGAGAAIMFIGVSVLAPLAARPVADIIGAPLPRLFGVSGRLAKDNTKRQPRRTASTASALMVGVALVAFFSIFAASAKESIAETVRDVFPADITVQSLNQSEQFPGPLSPMVKVQLGQIDAIETVSAMQFVFADIDGHVTVLAAIDPETVEEVLTTRPVGNALAEVATVQTVIASQSVFDDRSYTVGTVIDIDYGSGVEVPTTVVGAFEGDAFGDFFVSSETLAANVRVDGDNFVLASIRDGVALEDAKSQVDAVVTTFGNVEAQTKSELVADAETQIDQALRLFSGLLFLAVIIAILGIVNTLALSIFERTREIGLLRAVGMDRRQVRRIVRWEAVIIALFGTILGIAMGIFFGWAVVRALRDEGFGAFAIPVGQIVGSLILAGGAGVLAAIWPARRAAKLNVLDAIKYE